MSKEVGKWFGSRDVVQAEGSARTFREPEGRPESVPTVAAAGASSLAPGLSVERQQRKRDMWCWRLLRGEIAGGAVTVRRAWRSLRHRLDLRGASGPWLASSSA